MSSRRASAGKCKTDNSHVAAESVVDDEPVPTAFKEVAAAAASSLDENPASGGLLAAGIQLIQEGMILACSARLSRVPNLRTLSARGTCIDLPSYRMLLQRHKPRCSDLPCVWCAKRHSDPSMRPDTMMLTIAPCRPCVSFWATVCPFIRVIIACLLPSFGGFCVWCGVLW